jgi:hypothetical protein
VIPSGSTLDFVISGVNYKILDTDFYAALGVTGSIVQDGVVTGTPILDVAGSVNNIRNLENGPGVKASVSAENGATIEHNFEQDTVGAPVLINPEALIPAIASIEAGDGIAVTSIDNHIEISVSGVPVSTKTVVVNELSDLPSPDVGVITLADETEYLFTNDVDVGVNTFLMGDGTVISGADSSVITLTYTGSGTMFAATTTCRVDSITLSCASGTLFNAVAATGQEVFQMIDMTVSSCDEIGTVDGYGAIQINNVAFSDITTDGLLFNGTIGAFVGQTIIGVINAGTLFDLGTSVIGGFSLESSLFSLVGGGTVLLDGLVDSGNIATGGLGTVINNRIQGAGTPLNNIISSDDLWDFQINDDIQDTRTDAIISLTGNLTETVITTIDTPVLVAGTWDASQVASQFTVDANGRATFTGTKDTRLPITASSSVAMASGGTKSIHVYIAINGTEVSESGGQNDVSTISGRTTVIWQHTFSPGDFVELFVENNTDTTNIIVSDSVLRVN